MVIAISTKEVLKREFKTFNVFRVGRMTMDKKEFIFTHRNPYHQGKNHIEIHSFHEVF